MANGSKVEVADKTSQNTPPISDEKDLERDVTVGHVDGIRLPEDPDEGKTDEERAAEVKTQANETYTFKIYHRC